MEIQIIKTTTQINNTINIGIILNKTLSNIKMLHWYTGCYNMHLIFGELYDTLSDLFDKLQEEIIGTSRKTGIEFPDLNINLGEPDPIVYTDDEYILQEYYVIDNKIKDFFSSLEFKTYVNSVKSGIDNTKDEINTALNKATYLLHLIKK
jgi:hypothetical protein